MIYVVELVYQIHIQQSDSLSTIFGKLQSFLTEKVCSMRIYGMCNNIKN